MHVGLNAFQVKFCRVGKGVILRKVMRLSCPPMTGACKWGCDGAAGCTMSLS